MDIVSGLDEKIKDRHGFEFRGYDIVFKGICSKCREENDRAVQNE